MDAKDLMIGDWVEVTRTECVPDGGHYMTWSEYGKVIGVTDSYIEVEVRDGGYNVDAHEDEFKPIPLTPEILEKNGFEQKQSEFINGDIEIIFTIKGFSFWSKKTIEIAHGNGSKINNLPCYVHQLQHALRLCGIYKEIEI